MAPLGSYTVPHLKSRNLPVALLALALAVCADAAAAGQPRLFPLANGNRWTLREVETGAATTISVRKGLVLRAFPGAGDLRVRRAGQNVQAWDGTQRRWESFLRFGAPVGARYLVALRGVLLWESVEVTVASKRVVVRDYRGKVRRGCTRFTFRYRQPIADAGLEYLAFCPGVGPVSFSETTIAGPRTYALAGFKIRP